MYEIQDNIPVPETRRGRPQAKFPFAKLQVGQSFMVDVPPDLDALTVRNRMRVSAARWKKLYGQPEMKFMVAEHDGQVGVWRTT